MHESSSRRFARRERDDVLKWKNVSVAKFKVAKFKVSLFARRARP